jgi:hypothetical protein
MIQVEAAVIQHQIASLLMQEIKESTASFGIKYECQFICLATEINKFIDVGSSKRHRSITRTVFSDFLVTLCLYLVLELCGLHRMLSNFDRFHHQLIQ